MISTQKHHLEDVLLVHVSGPDDADDVDAQHDDHGGEDGGVFAEVAEVDGVDGHHEVRPERRQMGTKALRSVLGCFRTKEMCYLTTHSTHFIYGYMASHIW